MCVSACASVYVYVHACMFLYEHVCMYVCACGMHVPAYAYLQFQYVVNTELKLNLWVNRHWQTEAAKEH